MINPFDLISRADPAPENDSFKRFFRDILSDTLTSVLVFLVLGIVFVGVVSLWFNVSFLASLGICAGLGIAYVVANMLGHL